jgi:D-arginine dehydrogenase
MGGHGLLFSPARGSNATRIAEHIMSDAPVESADFLIIGAGIAGASAAYALAGHGRVAVLERESQPGYHTTGRSAALYTENYGNRTIRRLTKATGPFLKSPPAGFSEHPILTPRGALFIAREDQRHVLDALEAEIAVLGAAVERLDAAGALAMLPLLRPGYAVTGLYESDALDIDVHGLHRGYLRAASAQGGALRCDAEVRAIARRGELWRLDTSAGIFEAPVVVNAAGAWADEIASLAGVPTVGLQPKRRTAFTFDGPAETSQRTLPMCLDAQEQFYFKPEAGRFLGSLADETPSPPCDAQPEEIDIAMAVERIEAATIFQIRRLTHRWAGLRSFVADNSLVIGEAKAAPGFFWLAGQGGYGIQTSRAAGAALAGLAIEGRLPGWLTDAGLSAEDLAPDRPGLG